MLADKPIRCIPDLSKQILYNLNAYIVKRLCNYYVLLKVKILLTFEGYLLFYPSHFNLY